MTDALKVVIQACSSWVCNDSWDILRGLMDREIPDEAVLAQALHHGVLPAVYSGLSRAWGTDHPGVEALRQQQLTQSLQSFRALKEFVRLSEGLRDAGIPALALKGLALAQQVYGGVIQRPPGDLDLLVPPGLAWRAVGVLHDPGYSQEAPACLSDSQERALIRYGEGRQFRHGSGEYAADLHWRTLDRWVDVRLNLTSCGPAERS